MMDRTADARLKRNATRRVTRDGPRRAAVVAVTDGRLDGSTELAEVFGTWERIFQGQAERLAQES
jgi:ABC-type phosphate/phosphonate transport system substrate-binding protein